MVRKLADLGMFGILFPEKYGGSGLSYIDYVNILEEIAKVDGSLALTVAAHNSLCSNHIYLFGTDRQRAKYLPPLMSGDVQQEDGRCDRRVSAQ